MKLIIVRGLVIFLLLLFAAPASLQVASAQGPAPQTLAFPGYADLQQFAGKFGQRFTFNCLSRSKGAGYIEGSNLYGFDPYTWDSGICAAAVQQGAITFENGGLVTIEIRPGLQSYKGDTRNGVTSRDWGFPSNGSFVVISGGPAPSDTPAPSTCDWSGAWTRNGESFTFVQALAAPNGGAGQTQVTGTGITDPSWRLSGTVAGNVLTGKYSNSKDSGSVRIVMNPDCNSFESSWGVGDNFTSFTGHGVRAGPAGGQNASCSKELETLSLPSKGPIMQSSQTVLQNGQAYDIIVSGELGLYQNTSTGFDALYRYDSQPPQKTVSIVELNGRLILDWMKASAANTDYRTDHIYRATIPGNGKPLAARFVEGGDYNDNTGNLTVKLCPGTAGGGPLDPQPNTSVTNMTIQAGRRRVIAGELVTVPVWLIKASNVSNLNFHVSYDASVVKLEGSATKGDLLENALFSVNPNQAGSVLGGFAQTSGVAGTGTVMNIPFRATGKPGDRTQLDVTVTTINDPGGAVLQIDKLAGEILIYNKDGTFPPTGGTTSPPPPAMFKGDCDGDGILSEADALCALEMSVQTRPVNQLMDIDQSGGVDSRDAVIILQRALNK